MEGIIIYHVVDYQAAVELGGEAYRQRFGQPPTHVALPSCVDPAALELWTLVVARNKASAGTVQVLGEKNGREVA